MPCVLFAVALASLAACGGGEEEDAGDVVRDYLAAVADRDGPRACRLLTRKAQLRVFRRRRAHAGRDHPGQACATVVESFGPLYGRGRLRRAEVSEVSVKGDRAEARADRFPVKLVKVKDEWKITVSGLAQNVGDSPPPEPG